MKYHLAYASKPSCNASLLHSWVVSQFGYCNAKVTWKICSLGNADNLKGFTNEIEVQIADDVVVVVQ